MKEQSLEPYNNEYRILKFIIQKGCTTRKEIFDNLKLSMPTVFQYINNLMAKNLIESGNFQSSATGRKAQTLSPVKNKYASIGIDITKNHVTFVLVDLSGELMSQSHIRLSYSNSISYYINLGNQLYNFLDNFRKGNDCYYFLGAGISIPGIINPEDHMLIRSHILNVQNINLESFCVNISYNVCFENDANCAAYAEIEEDRSNLYLSLNNTVGGAIYLNGKLYTGDNFKSAEFGHIIINTEGAKCYCGKRGCLDTYCSSRVLLSDEEGDLQDFFSRVKTGDEESIKKLEAYLNYLAIGITNLRMAFDCDITLGGDVGGYLCDYIGILQTRLREYNNFDSSSTYLKLGKFKNLSSAIGAAYKITDETLQQICSASVEDMGNVLKNC